MNRLRQKRWQRWHELQGPFFTPWIEGGNFDNDTPMAHRSYYLCSGWVTPKRMQEGIDRERLLLQIYFNEQTTGGEYVTLKELGMMRGLSAERVRQLVEKTIERCKFRNRLKKYFNREDQHGRHYHG